VDRVTMQFHATQPFIDTEVLINTTVITDIDPELVQSSTVTAGVVKITTEELLALPGAQAFLDALAEAAHDKLAAERAALIDPPAPPPQPASAPFEPERPVLPSPLG
jgi:hypothetical protein